MKNKLVKYWLENKTGFSEEYEKRLESYNESMDAMIEKLEGLIGPTGINGRIKGRVKGFEALYRKLISKSQEHDFDDPFEFITDIIGVRIVVPFIEDIKHAEDLIRGHFGVLEVQYKSLELTIREFGYDSVHFTVEIPDGIARGEAQVCEIQLLTILQEAWAEVEHELVYKTTLDSVEDPIRRKLIALKATLSLADTTFQEIRDYQRKRYQDLQERHKKLMDKVSTLPEKMNSSESEAARNALKAALPAGRISDAEMNDLYIEALNAHVDGKLDKAMQLYTHIIMIAPNHYLYNHRGLVYFALGEYDKAVADFNAALGIEPSDSRVFTNRGLAYRMLKRFDEALDDFTRSLDKNPLWPDTFYGRALTYYDMGNVKAAVEDCDKAIALKPGFKQAVRFKQFLLNLLFE